MSETDDRTTRVSVPGVLLAALLVVAVGVALYRERKPALDLDAPLSATERALEGKHRDRRVATLRSRCRERDCDCAGEASSAALDVDASDAALTLLKSASRCLPRERFDGLHAEAMMRKGDSAAGMKEATAVLAKSPNDAHALYTQALFGYRAGQFDPALELAARSQRAGRGNEAVALSGLVAFAKNDLDAAKSAFRTVLESEPNDVDALFNLGVVAQKLGRYGEARATYLKLTRLSPSHQNARYHLAILAHSAGAMDEARHHLAKLRALGAPTERVRELEAELAKPSATPPSQVLVLGGSKEGAP